MDDLNESSKSKKAKRLKYGSLEHQVMKSGNEAIEMGVKAGNINISNKSETMEMSMEDRLSQRHKDILASFERRKKLRQVNVTTDSDEVRKQLRALHEPITLFGEGPADRRERLRELLAAMKEAGIKPVSAKNEPINEEQDELSKKTWYHEGPESLKTARLWIADYSVPKAKIRLQKQRDEKEKKNTARLQHIHRHMQSVTSHCSQVCDTRPVASCKFSPNSKYLATAGWSGACKLWSVPDCEEIIAYQGHNMNATGIVFHPEATISLEENVCNLASCAADGSVKLWALNAYEPIADLEGIEGTKVSKLAFHPSGRFLGLTCWDKSWRLWDLEQEEEVLHQEGHSKPVHDIDFQCDGALAVTSGLDTFGRIWDLRTGRCVMFLEGHLKEMIGVCFSPNGYHVASGSADNTVKVWDLRKTCCMYTIPAHTSLVSSVQYQKTNGDFLITGSYDKTAKVWAYPGFLPLRTLHGHENKIMCVDVSADGEYISTSSYDRTMKLWAKDDQVL